MALTTYKTAASTDRAAIIRIMKGLNEMGWVTVSHNDTEEDHHLHGASPETVADKVAETDMAYIRVVKEVGVVVHRATLMFVLGNSPWEVLADCSCSDAFDPDMKAVEEAINLEGCN